MSIRCFGRIFLYIILSNGIYQLSRYKIKKQLGPTLNHFMDFQSDKFFTLETLFQIESSPQGT